MTAHGHTLAAARDVRQSLPCDEREDDATPAGPESGRATGPWGTGSPPDQEALLVALTLSPATYSRNRFYEMYTSPEVKRTRRRASQLRSVVTAFVSEASARGAGRLVSLDATGDGGAVVVYDVTSLGMRRTVRLHAIELSLLRYCVGRVRSDAAPAELRPRSDNGERIGVALQRLSPLPAPAPPSETA